jgi:hypothetical protein
MNFFEKYGVDDTECTFSETYEIEEAGDSCDETRSNASDRMLCLLIPMPLLWKESPRDDK